MSSLLENSATDRRLFYACALDAQEIGNRPLALKALNSILIDVETHPAEASRIPVIVRCTIRICLTMIEENRDTASYIELLCDSYEKGMQTSV
jgi:hypothetical protein